jgi:hypothetical protein
MDRIKTSRRELVVAGYERDYVASGHVCASRRVPLPGRTCLDEMKWRDKGRARQHTPRILVTTLTMSPIRTVCALCPTF